MGKRYYKGSILKARKEVRSQIKKILDDQLNDTLSVDKIHYGRRIPQSKIQPPMLWVIEVPWEIESVGHNAEIHPFTFGFVALIRGVDKIAEQTASTVVDQVYGIFDNNRTLNGACHFARPQNIDLTGEYSPSKQIWWASIEWQFLLRRIINS